MLKTSSTLALSQVNTVKRRFLLQNRERLNRTQSSLRDRQRDFLDVLPLLFHINHPSLPGFVSKDTPAGISDYSPTEASMKSIKKYAKSFAEKRRALLRYEIYSLFLMGSSGTVAYSKKSDFDIWVCHDKSIKPERLDELRQKCLAIESWAMELDLEVHFFLVEPETFSKGVHEDMSAESSGSAQHYLLMEEFYRTGLLIAGRYPLWWMVPPNEEKNYYEYVETLLDKRFINDLEYVDFGPLPGLPAEEFFGAALWQLYKGIDSPYKSVLKLLLMESYASEYPDIELLCHRFKREIYKGETDLDHLDPYMMMYYKLEDYLISKGEDERLALARKCFYFKVNEPLSVKVKERDYTWRREAIEAVTQSWDWGHAYVEMLDARSNWKIDRVLKERTLLVKALTHSYRLLSDFARKNAQLVTIDQHDLNVLGRKLYAAFERKAGKVDIVNRGISNDLLESHLSFYHVKGEDGRHSWLLYAAPLNPVEAFRSQPLKRSFSLLEIIAWCHFNNLMDSRTVLAVHSDDNSVATRELKEIFFTFQRLFTSQSALRTNMEDFSVGARSLQTAVFVNLGTEPMQEFARKGHQLLSDKTDALCYGGLGENLAVSFDMVTVTSWKEILTARYEGVAGLIDCLRDYLRWVSFSHNDSVPEVSAHCFTAGRGLAIGQRIEELFRDIVTCFFGDGPGESSRYVFNVEQYYFILQMRESSLQYERATNYDDLLVKLGAGSAVFSPITIDRHAVEKTMLPHICAVNKPRAIQVFYQAVQPGVDVYILDERGGLYYQKMAFVNKEDAIVHFNLFFDSVLNRQNFDAVEVESEVDEIRYYEVMPQSGGAKPLLVRREVPDVSGRRSSFDIQVIGDVSAGHPVFTFYCDDRDYSSVEFGDKVTEEVARYVLSKRRSGERYPIYITDMDLPRQMLDEQGTARHIQTLHYLKYKRRIEDQLFEALKSIKL